MYSDYSDLEQSLMKQSLVTSRKNDRLHRLSLVHPPKLKQAENLPGRLPVMGETTQVTSCLDDPDYCADRWIGGGNRIDAGCQSGPDKPKSTFKETATGITGHFSGREEKTTVRTCDLLVTNY
jgi:hypothetical protein